jgi:5-methylcytosine-specific restriction endonuclease McrA
MGLRKSSKKKNVEPRPSGSSRRKIALQIVLTDSTYVWDIDRGFWVGDCIFCGTKLVVWDDGHTAATIEHIVPLSANGTNDLKNLALACSGCNASKARHHDKEKDVADSDVVKRLLSDRVSRWRNS